LRKQAVLSHHLKAPHTTDGKHVQTGAAPLVKPKTSRALASNANRSFATSSGATLAAAMSQAATRSISAARSAFCSASIFDSHASALATPAS
jgi:hypothetical protein